MSEIQYKRPVSDEPTRHLFVGNCGPRCAGQPFEAVLALLERFGELQHCQEGPANIWATFPSEHEAIEAFRALQDHQPDALSKPLIVQFADVSKQKVLRSAHRSAPSARATPSNG